MTRNTKLMGKISKILVLSDGSKTAKRAVAYAVDLAKHLRASIIALSVIDHRSLIAQTVSASENSQQTIEPLEENLRDAAERHTGEIKKLCDKKGVEATIFIQRGNPAEEIVKEAKRLKADLIVMGSQGRSDLPETVLGNVSYGVIGNDIGWCRIS